MRAPWTAEWRERGQQIAWVTDYQADLDADFLAIYRIDLETDDITGPRYFALAHRLTAYQGVMAARAEQERERPEPAPTRSRNEAPQASSSSGAKEVSLTAFRVMFPGIVSGGGTAGGG